MNRFPLKIKISIALLLLIVAGTIYFNKNKPVTTNDILVKIKYIDSEDLIKVPPYPKEVEIRVTGTKKRIGYLKQTSCNIDLRTFVKGINKVFIKDYIKLPRGIKIVRVAPEFINVNLGTRTYKRFPVQVVTTGKPASGYWLTGKRVEPDHVLLSGPSQTIRNLKVLYTKPIDLALSRESFKKEVALDLNESLVNRSGKIFATIEVKEKIVIRKIKNIPVKGIGTKRSFKILPEIMDIEIKGPESSVRLNHIKEKIKVFIDMNGLKKGMYVRRAVISIPIEFTLVKAKPANFTVNIN